MQRGESGGYEVTIVGSEQVRAFVPAPLPPLPPLSLDSPLQRGLEAAVLELGRLDGVSTLLPDKSLFLSPTSARKQCSPPKSRGRNHRSPTSCCSSSMRRPVCRSTMSWRSRTTSRRSITGSPGCAAAFRSRTA